MIPKVKQLPYWVANLAEAVPSAVPPDPERVSGSKDTTHISIIDKDGNIFDSTPSGGWIGGAVILGDTGIGMSVRGEQFWLDKTRAAQLQPRARPRYTLTPSIVLKNGQPFMALGTPGGDNQEQTILQAFLNIVEFWPDWYPNLHEAFEWPRLQTLHFYGSFWPHDSGFNKLNLESQNSRSRVQGTAGPRPRCQLHQAVQHRELRHRRHDRSQQRQPHRRAPIRRRDCYAMAY